MLLGRVEAFLFALRLGLAGKAGQRRLLLFSFMSWFRCWKQNRGAHWTISFVMDCCGAGNRYFIVVIIVTYLTFRACLVHQLVSVGS